MNRTKISRVSLIVCACIIVLTAFIPSLPPDLAPIFGLAALASIPAIFAGPTKFRILGITALLLTIFLVGMQVYRGKQRTDRRREMILKVEKAQADNLANKASEAIGDPGSPQPQR